MKRFAVLTN